jgi:hypothetical protein
MAEEKIRVKKRIIVEDEEDSDGEKENAGNGEKENAVAKIMKRFTPSTEWTDSGLGSVSLKGGDTVYLQVRVVTPVSALCGRKQLQSVWEFRVITNGSRRSNAESDVTVSQFDDIIVRLDKMMIPMTESTLTRIVVHWVFFFLKTNCSRAKVFENNMRDRDDCHEESTAKDWQRVFRKQFNLFVTVGGSTCFPGTSAEAEDILKAQLKMENAIWNNT